MADLAPGVEVVCGTVAASFAKRLAPVVGVPYHDIAARAAELVRDEARRLLTSQPTALTALEERRRELEEAARERDELAALADAQAVAAREAAEDHRDMRSEHGRLAEQVERVRALDLHQGSAHFPDKCCLGCPGCAVAAALDGTEAGR